MEEKELLKKASNHAAPLIFADPLLSSIAEKLLCEKARQSKISGMIKDSEYTAANAGHTLVEYYIEKLAAAKRISHENASDHAPHAFDNLLRISGLTRDECAFLIQSRLARWEKEID